MTPRSRVLAALVAGSLLMSAVVGPAAAHDRITTKVTWDREIAPIFHARCAACHAPGRSTIALTTYQDARPWAAAIKEEVLTRRMPRWNAARGYGDFANDPSLSPFEIALIAAWVDGGAPEREKKGPGDDRPAAIAAPPAPAAPRRMPSRTVTLPCTEQSVSGRLIAISPRLEPGGDAGIAARLPDGRQEIVAWIRNYDPGSPTIYWLRSPLTLRRGSRLLVEASGACSIRATFAK